MKLCNSSTEFHFDDIEDQIKSIKDKLKKGGKELQEGEFGVYVVGNLFCDDKIPSNLRLDLIQISPSRRSFLSSNFGHLSENLVFNEEKKIGEKVLNTFLLIFHSIW